MEGPSSLCILPSYGLNYHTVQLKVPLSFKVSMRFCVVQTFSVISVFLSPEIIVHPRVYNKCRVVHHFLLSRNAFSSQLSLLLIASYWSLSGVVPPSLLIHFIFTKQTCLQYLSWQIVKEDEGGNLIADLPFRTKKRQLMTKKCIHNRNVGIWTSLQHVHHLFSAMDLTWIHILFSRRLPCVRPDSVKHIISVFFSSYNAKHICYCNRLFEEHDSVLSKLCDCIISISKSGLKTCSIWTLSHLVWSIT